MVTGSWCRWGRHRRQRRLCRRSLGTCGQAARRDEVRSPSRLALALPSRNDCRKVVERSAHLPPHRSGAWAGWRYHLVDGNRQVGRGVIAPGPFTPSGCSLPSSRWSYPPNLRSVSWTPVAMPDSLMPLASAHGLGRPCHWRQSSSGPSMLNVATTGAWSERFSAHQEGFSGHCVSISGKRSARLSSDVKRRSTSR